MQGKRQLELTTGQGGICLIQAADVAEQTYTWKKQVQVQVPQSGPDQGHPTHGATLRPIQPLTSAGTTYLASLSPLVGQPLLAQPNFAAQT